MSPAATVITALAAAAASVSLWWAARRVTVPLRAAYRWFALAAGLWGMGAVLSQALPVPVGAAAIPLSFGDLPALLALPAMAAGLVRLAAAGAAEATQPLPPGRISGRGGIAARVADGYIMASALFLICWLVQLRTAYLAAGTGPAIFTVELVHPLADFLLLGAGLPLAAAAGRRGALPYLAVVTVATGDALAVGARTAGDAPGVAALLTQAAGLMLLACVPWAGAGWRAIDRLRDRLTSGRKPGAGRAASPVVPSTAQATVIAGAAAGLAAAILIGWAAAGETVDRPVVAIAAGTTLLALAVRTLWVVRGEHSATWIWSQSRARFRELADRTSDAVLLCDLGGVIRFASRAVAGYGYPPDALLGTPLADLLHPEDRSGGSRAVRRAVTSDVNRVGRYPCRVRAADGTWRHVESTVARYQEPGGPVQLLVTARDMSAQVALRRQVTHLTFHDGLTGLPNRAYIEQRVREAGPEASPVVAGQPLPAHQPIGGVILLDLDGFTAVNADVGHGAGDLLLAQVGRRLRAAVPPQDTVARWGGDEFAVLIDGTVSAEEVIDIARRLARSVASPAFQAGDREVSLTASVGVALPAAGPDVSVWHQADMAMSRAKEQGQGRVEVFTGEPAVSGGGGQDAGTGEAGKDGGAQEDGGAGMAGGCRTAAR
jgi:diguanylate cyclase (GGDEF)-like protein